MVDNNLDKITQQSEIQNYFYNRCVLLTGATGFLGMLLLEKLLRTCIGINKIFILLRQKKNKSRKERINEMLKNEVFDHVRTTYPKFAEKIVVLAGDCMLPDLGLTEDARNVIINEVNCIFNCAATVRFDEKLRTAVYTNVRATRDLLNLAKEMKHLSVFIQVSTAFSNYIHKEIDEEFYVSPFSGKQIIAIVNNIDDDVLEKITPILIGKWPNTYTFSKACAEEVVRSCYEDIPIAIVRPSAILSTASEPQPGWSSNLYGVIGVLIGVGTGRIRVANGSIAYVADIVPADYVVNCIIAAAWHVGTRSQYNKNPNSNKYYVKDQQHSDREISGHTVLPNEEYQDVMVDEAKQVLPDIPIFNYVSGVEMPITWGTIFAYVKHHYRNITPDAVIWNYICIAFSSKLMFVIFEFLLHTVPAYAVDFLGKLVGKNFELVKTYHKIGQLLRALAYFPSREWQFRNHNTQALWRKLNSEDKKLYNFDLSNIDWNNYMYMFVIGTRKYLLKEPIVASPKERGNSTMLKVAYYVVGTIVFFAIYKLLLIIGNTIL